MICRCTFTSLGFAMLTELRFGILWLDKVECFCQKFMASSLLCSCLSFLVKRLLSFSWHNRLFNCLLEGLVICGLSQLLVLSVMLDGGDAQENILLEVVVLDFLPLASKVTDSALSKLNLVRCEFTVLT